MIHQAQIGLKIHVVQLRKSGIIGWKFNGFDRIASVLPWQQPKADGGLHFKTEISEPTQGQRIRLGVKRIDLHGCCTPAEPTLMLVKVGRNRVGIGPHFHAVTELAAIATHLWILSCTVTEGFVGWSRQKQHGRTRIWRIAVMNQCKASWRSVCVADSDHALNDVLHHAIGG